MSTKKILEFNPQGPSLFCRHLEFLAKTQGWEMQFETHTEFHPELLKEADLAKVDLSLSESVLGQVHLQTSLVRLLRAVDSFVKEDGSWYPRVMLFEALRRVFVDCARDLDIRAPAFVVGHTELARIVASVLAQVGFSEIYVVGQDAGLLMAEIELLKRNHLGIEFKPLMADQLTVQSVSAAIAVNTVDISQDKELLNDLSYFNFMKREGYALDMNLLPFENPLLEEATRAELRVLHPSWVAAEVTSQWLEKLQLGTSLKVEELRESWKTFLKEISSSV